LNHRAKKLSLRHHPCRKRVPEYTTFSSAVLARDVTDFKSNFESDGFCHFFTNPNPTALQTGFLTDSDLIFVFNFRKINCCPLTV